MSDNTQNSAIPLCVDLDGTLSAGDVMYESALELLKRAPLYAFAFPFWLAGGVGSLKKKLMEKSFPNVDASFFREEIVDFAKREKKAGRKIYLVTASMQEIAEAVAERVGIFDGVFGSTEKLNLTGERKARFLVDRFGENGYDYIGDSKKDLPVWRSARKAHLVEPTASVLSAARFTADVDRVFGEKPSLFKSFVKEIRVYQWIKNILIFLPLLLAHRFEDWRLFADVVAAFFAFSLTASSVYVINDLSDIESDRAHIRKRKRPIASGALPIPIAAVSAPALLAAGFAIAIAFLPAVFSLVLALYFTITTAYSFLLKRVVLLDVITLASLYTIRLIAGSAAVDVPLSQWLLSFSMFLFLSLAILKRYIELSDLKSADKKKAAGRGYSVEHLPLLLSFGAVSGYLAVLILALYINSAEVVVLYNRPEILWALNPLLLYWITRMWFVAQKGEMHDDPVIFAGKDPVGYIVGFIAAALVAAAAI